MTARIHCAATASGDKLILLGGLNKQGETLGSVEALDLETQKWSLLANILIPTPRSGCVAVTIENKVFLLGGWSDGKALACCEVLDLVTMSWDKLPPMNTQRSNFAACVVEGNLIFVVGGFYNPTLDSVEIYDTEKQRWEPLPPMSTPRKGCAATAVEESVFVFGGEGESGNKLRSTEVFHLGDLKWGPLPDMLRARSGCTAVAFDTKILVFGGAEDGSSEFFDIIKQRWFLLPNMSVPRKHAGVAKVDVKIVVAGGQTEDEQTSSSDEYGQSSKVGNRTINAENYAMVLVNIVEEMKAQMKAQQNEMRVMRESIDSLREMAMEEFQGLSGVVRELRKIQHDDLMNIRGDIQSLGNTIQDARDLMSFLATGQTLPCPKLVWMVPGKLNGFKKMLKPIKSKWKVFFICEKNFCLANPDTPLELELTRQCIRRLAPVLKVSLIALGIAGSIAIRILTGLPMPSDFISCDDTIKKYEDMLLEVMADESMEAICKNMEESGVFAEMDKLFGSEEERKDLVRKKLIHMRQLTGKSYEYFSEKAREHKDRWEPLMKIEVIRGIPLWVAIRGAPMLHGLDNLSQNS